MWFSKQSCSPVTPAETDSDVFFPPGSALSGGACVISSLWVLTSLFETLSIAQGWDDSVAAAEAPVRSSERLFPKRSRERRLFIHLRTSTLTSWQHLPVLHKNILVQAILESEAKCVLVWKDYVEGCLIYLTTQQCDSCLPMTEFDSKCFELSRKIHGQELTFELCAGAGCSVDGRNRPGKTEPLVLRPALFPSGALLEDFNDRILLQELSMKSADPKRRTHTRWVRKTFRL